MSFTHERKSNRRVPSACQFEKGQKREAGRAWKTLTSKSETDALNGYSSLVREFFEFLIRIQDRFSKCIFYPKTTYIRFQNLNEQWNRNKNGFAVLINADQLIAKFLCVNL